MIIQHNLSQENVLFTDKHFEQKLLAPSIGIVRTNNIIDGFGEIKLFSNSNKPLQDSIIYSNDIYSPRMDFLVYKFDDKKTSELYKNYGITINEDSLSFGEFKSKYERKFRGKIENDTTYTNLLNELKSMHLELSKLEHQKTNSKDSLKISNLKNEIRLLTKELRMEADVDYKMVSYIVNCIEQKEKGISPKSVKEFEADYTQLVELKSLLLEKLILENNPKQIEFVIRDLKRNGLDYSKEESLLDKFNENSLDIEINNLKEQTKSKNDAIQVYKQNNPHIEDSFNNNLKQIFNDITKPGLYMESSQNQITGKVNYKKATNSNIIKELTNNIVNGENFFTTPFIYFRNTMSATYSIKDFDKYIDRLANNENESFDSINKFNQYIEDTYNINPDEFYKLFEEGKIAQNDLYNLKIEFNNIFKSHYFEAKPYREVSYNEFDFAFVPENCNSKVIEILESNNLKIHYYHKGENLNDKLQSLLNTPQKSLDDLLDEDPYLNQNLSIDKDLNSSKSSTKHKHK